MRLIRSVLIAVVGAALLLTSVVATTVAADDNKGKMAFVQGRPGVKVDICVNGREVVSKLAFAKYAYRRQAPGWKVVTVAKAAPGACKGTRLAVKAFKFPKQADFTVVTSKKAPKKIMVFDNAYPPGPYVSGSHRFFRNASDFGDVTFRHEARNLQLDPAAADPVWSKGDSSRSYIGIAVGGTPVYSTTWVTGVPLYMPPNIVAGPRFIGLGKHHRYEWILVGNDKVQKLVVLRRYY